MSDRNNNSLSDNSIDESNVTMPLLAGGMARPEGMPEANDFDDGKPARKGLSQGTMLLIGLLVTSAGALYLMRSTQGEILGTAGSEVEAKIEQALARLSNPHALSSTDTLAKNNVNALFKDTNNIVAMFAIDPSTRQVPLEFVQKNPFQLSIARAAETGSSAPTAVNNDARTRKLEAELKALKLQTIMGGTRPVAVINGELYQPGQQVGSFTIKTIAGMAVQLEADGATFVMKMEDSGKGKPGQTPRSR